ncbi:helix-turn-helix transcriptional regulator [Pedobacter nutrimenti]|uniref:helix-turn-helix domain-containing protein n=1 Tax=Pedobacter nutrimenti TaxID=1241337 RepID=UPI002931AD33|nr:helix-turn-helix transcriptional regulator [Pedobacter nutrimenti]
MQEILSKKDIGERIKALRTAQRLSQSKVADLLSISRSNYSQIELGNQFPSFNILNVIARYYSKSYNWLLHGKDREEQATDQIRGNAVIQELENTLETFNTLLKKLEKEILILKTSSHQY